MKSFLLILLIALLSSCTELKISGIDIAELKKTLGANGDSSQESSELFETIFDATIPFTSGGPAVANQNYTCGVTKTRNVLCWGANNLGQLGDGTYDDSLDLVTVVGGEQGEAELENIIAVAAGHSHTCAVESSGAVYCWGQTATNNMGHDQNASLVHSLPMRVLAGEQTTGSVGGHLGNIKFITAGIRNRCGVTNQNEVLCWGQTFSAHPTYVQAGDQGSGRFKNVLTLKFSAVNLCAFNTDNKPYCWLFNGQGQLGLGFADGGYMEPQFLDL